MTSTPNDPFSDPSQQAEQPPQPYGQPQYAQPPAPQGPPIGSVRSTEKNWMNITSLVLSLAGLITGITAIGGIILGHMGLRAVKRGEADNRGLGIAGLISGYVILLLGILVTVAWILFMGWAFSECGGDNPADWCTE